MDDKKVRIDYNTLKKLSEDLESYHGKGEKDDSNGYYYYKKKSFKTWSSHITTVDERRGMYKKRLLCRIEKERHFIFNNSHKFVFSFPSKEGYYVGQTSLSKTLNVAKAELMAKDQVCENLAKEKYKDEKDIMHFTLDDSNLSSAF